MEFLKYCKNHFKYKLFKILLYGIIALFIFILFGNVVNAEVNYDYEFLLLNRDYDQLPFNTWYAAGESSTYSNTNSIRIYGTNENLYNPPRYLYAVYCATGSINFNTTSVSSGDITNNGDTWGSSCTVNSYNGNYHLNRWTINDWADLSSSQVYQWGVVWTINVYNSYSYPVYMELQSVFLSNELIQDFSSDALLAEILAQNSSLKNSINDIQSGQSGIESSIEQSNEKLDQTNEELGSVNDNLEKAEETRKGIWETIKDLPNAFLNMLKSLFIPDDNYFSDWFNELKEFFELKLGFLATPFTIVIDFVNKYLELDSSDDIIINIPNITVPNFEEHIIIEATTFNWSDLLKSKEALNTLWQLYLAFVDVFLILNFIGLCETKYNRIFGGDTSNYEYYTVEDSITYDGQTGEVVNQRQNERRTTRKKVK